MVLQLITFEFSKGI